MPLLANLRTVKASLPHRLKSFLGIDSAIAWVIIGKIWSIVAGPLTLFLIVAHLSLTEQGYYYTFSSLLGMVMFFELGLGTWIVIFTSYERPNLRWAANGTISSNAAALNWLSQVLRFAVRWFSFAGSLFFVFVMSLGLFFFGSESDSSLIDWRLPWLLVVTSSTINIILSPFLSLLEGLGLVAELAFINFLRYVSASVTLWVALLAGLRLLSLSVSTLVGLAPVIAYLIGKRYTFMGLWGSRINGMSSFEWQRELLPLQWRTAVSVISGYFIWQTATPIIFKLSGPDQAGKFGMTWSLASMLTGFGISWINTKVPVLGALIGQGNRHEVDRLFRASMIRALLVVMLGSTAILLATIGLNAIGHRFAVRLLSPANVLILFLSNIMSTIQISLYTYVRLFKQEPFVGQVVTMALLMPLSCYIGLRLWDMTGMLLCMFVVSSVIGLLWTFVIYLSIREA